MLGFVFQCVVVWLSQVFRGREGWKIKVAGPGCYLGCCDESRVTSNERVAYLSRWHRFDDDCHVPSRWPSTLCRMPALDSLSKSDDYLEHGTHCTYFMLVSNDFYERNAIMKFKPHL